MPDLKTIAAIALAAVPIGLLIFAGINAWLAARNERRRTQPVVIAHEASKRGFGQQAGTFQAVGYITNEGGGPAFNVRGCPVARRT